MLICTWPDLERYIVVTQSGRKWKHVGTAVQGSRASQMTCHWYSLQSLSSLNATMEHCDALPCAPGALGERHLVLCPDNVAHTVGSWCNQHCECWTVVHTHTYIATIQRRQAHIQEDSWEWDLSDSHTMQHNYARVQNTVDLQHS